MGIYSNSMRGCGKIRYGDRWDAKRVSVTKSGNLYCIRIVEQIGPVVK